MLAYHHPVASIWGHFNKKSEDISEVRNSIFKITCIASRYHWVKWSYFCQSTHSDIQRLDKAHPKAIDIDFDSLLSRKCQTSEVEVLEYVTKYENRIHVDIYLEFTMRYKDIKQPTWTIYRNCRRGCNFTDLNIDTAISTIKIWGSKALWGHVAV